MHIAACYNSAESCDYWARQGECETNPDFMYFKCESSCRNCDTSKPPIVRKLTGMSQICVQFVRLEGTIKELELILSLQITWLSIVDVLLTE